MEVVLPVINPDTKQLYSQSASLGLIQYNYSEYFFVCPQGTQIVAVRQTLQLFTITSHCAHS